MEYTLKSVMAILQIIARNLDPALRWTQDHQAALTACNGEAAVHAFEFRLHQLQFLHCLQSSGGPWIPSRRHLLQLSQILHHG